MAEVSSLSESENYAESDFETSPTEEKKKKNFYPKRKRKYHHLSEHFSKSKNNVKVKSSSTAGKTFTYLGKTRKKKKVPLLVVIPFNILHNPSNSHKLFHHSLPINQHMT
jgi:hypothetical protein